MAKHRRLAKVGFGISKVLATIGGLIAGAAVGGIVAPIIGIIRRREEVEQEITAYERVHVQGGMHPQDVAIKRQGAYCHPIESIGLIVAGPFLGAIYGAETALHAVRTSEKKHQEGYKSEQRAKTNHGHGFFCNHKQEPTQTTQQPKFHP